MKHLSHLCIVTHYSSCGYTFILKFLAVQFRLKDKFCDQTKLLSGIGKAVYCFRLLFQDNVLLFQKNSLLFQDNGLLFQDNDLLFQDNGLLFQEQWFIVSRQWFIASRQWFIV